MTDRKALADSNETPEDVATLYSWANLHGAKYRDFSASRAQSREQARLRAFEASRTESVPADQARRTVEAGHAEDQVRISEIAALQAAQRATRQGAQRPSVSAPQPTPVSIPPQMPLQARPLGQLSFSQSLRAASPEIPQASHPERYAVPTQTPQPTYPGSQPLYPVAPAPQAPPMREEPLASPEGTSWAAPEARENPLRPAWLATRPAPPAQSAGLPAPEDTIQGSRDRLTSRWFALKGIFDGNAAGTAAAEAQPAQTPLRVPVLGIFSLAGGVGKTSLVATLGRALSARGERVLLVDTAAYGLLPFFFGARDQRPGQLRTFTPPASSGDSPIQMVTVDPDSFGPETAVQEGLTAEVAKYSHGVGRVIVDLATASGSTTRRILKLQPLILVPVVPDMNSVVSVSSIDAFFERNAGAAGKAAMPYYVLNQFDPSLPLHLDVREVLREQIGERLLPFALRRAPTVSEALAEGMTVMDYAPNSTVAEDFSSLAGWVKTVSAPAGSSFRGVRWSER